MRIMFHGCIKLQIQFFSFFFFPTFFLYRRTRPTQQPRIFQYPLWGTSPPHPPRVDPPPHIPLRSPPPDTQEDPNTAPHLRRSPHTRGQTLQFKVGLYSFTPSLFIPPDREDFFFRDSLVFFFSHPCPVNILFFFLTRHRKFLPFLSCLVSVPYRWGHGYLRLLLTSREIFVQHIFRVLAILAFHHNPLDIAPLNFRLTP